MTLPTCKIAKGPLSSVSPYRSTQIHSPKNCLVDSLANEPSHTTEYLHNLHLNFFLILQYESKELPHQAISDTKSCPSFRHIIIFFCDQFIIFKDTKSVSQSASQSISHSVSQLASHCRILESLCVRVHARGRLRTWVKGSSVELCVPSCSL
jgi:hypothetical protein